MPTTSTYASGTPPCMKRNTVARALVVAAHAVIAQHLRRRPVARRRRSSSRTALVAKAGPLAWSEASPVDRGRSVGRPAPRPTRPRNAGAWWVAPRRSAVPGLSGGNGSAQPGEQVGPVPVEALRVPIHAASHPKFLRRFQERAALLARHRKQEAETGEEHRRVAELSGAARDHQDQRPQREALALHEHYRR